MGIAALEVFHIDIFSRQVVASGKPGFKQQPGAVRFSQDRSIKFNTHMARTGQDIDSLVRIPWMDEDLFFLLEPGVHILPAEAYIILQFRIIRFRLWMGEGGVGCPSRAHP